MRNKIKKTPKAVVANFYISSILNRLVKVASDTLPATKTKDSPELPNPLTFLHNFIDGLELNQPIAMLTAAANQLACLYPASTTILFFASSGEAVMVMAGSAPAPLINQEILKIKDQIQPPEGTWQTINNTRKKTTIESAKLTVLAATKPDSNYPKILLFSTATPTTKERQLAHYCLQHLNKRISEGINFIELQKSNRLDSLTGLNNRRHFDEIMKRESDRADRYHHPTSLMMLDLDYFKKVNDNFGHQTGDQVLKTVGRILLSEVRQSDTPCRYGGEEFAIILPETGLSEAQRIGERFRQLIERQQILTHNNVNLKITSSIGVSSTEQYHNIDLTAAADQALYIAKNRGRNQVATCPSPSETTFATTIKNCFPTKCVVNE